MQKFRDRVLQYILSLLFIVTLLVWYATAAEDRDGKLTVAFLNVGQGDAIFIESPSGNQVVFDGGPDSSLLRELGKVMPFYDRSLDLLVVTNPDKDHFAGFLGALRAYRVGAVLEPGTVGASAEYVALAELINQKEVPHLLARRGQRIDIGGGAFIEILFPDRDVSGISTNNGSIVAKLVYGNTSVLLTGDTTEAVENYLTSLDGKSLDVDVLKVGHHGSRTSTGTALLGFASPAMAVISAGKDNSYGHPHPEVLARLEQFEVETLGTYERGTISMESDGETIRIKK